jgi:hypothetical protein
VARLQRRWPAAIFYPFGHSTPCAYVFQVDREPLFILHAFLGGKSTALSVHPPHFHDKSFTVTLFPPISDSLTYQLPIPFPAWARMATYKATLHKACSELGVLVI